MLEGSLIAVLLDDSWKSMGNSSLDIVAGCVKEPKVLLRPKSYRQEGRGWAKDLGLSFPSKGFSQS